jgi:Amt family ammonium transporter
MLGGTTIPTLGIQFSGLVVLVLYGVPAAYAIFKICDRLVGVRSPPEQEREGLDLSEHGLEAYPVDPGNR